MADPDPSGAAGRRLVIVGASGWIGGALLRAARRRGVAAQGVGRLPDLGALLGGPGVVVVNAAGRTSGTPRELRLANVELVERLADACAAARAALLQTGSAAEYGVPAGPMLTEADPEAPVSDYGRSKLAATQVLRERAGAGLACTTARVFNVIGRGRRDSDPIQEFAAAVCGLPPEGGVVRAFDSSLVRDFASIGWVADRFLDLAAHVGEAPVVNVCTGRGVAFRDMIRAMAEVRHVRVQVLDTAPGGLQRVVGDPALMHTLLGAAPREALPDLARLALAAVPS